MKPYIILIALTLAGCAAKTGNPVLAGSESGISRQMQPLRTKNDVRNTFGNPDLVFEKDKTETYEYRRIDGNGRYHWLLPVFGWFASLFQNNFEYEETNLFIRFDGDDIRDWKVVQTGGTVD